MHTRRTNSALVVALLSRVGMRNECNMDPQKKRLQEKPRERRRNLAHGTASLGAIAVPGSGIEEVEQESNSSDVAGIISAGEPECLKKRFGRKFRKEGPRLAEDPESVGDEAELRQADDSNERHGAEDDDNGGDQDGDEEDLYDDDSIAPLPLPYDAILVDSAYGAPAAARETTADRVSNQILALTKSTAQMRHVLETAASAKVLAVVDETCPADLGEEAGTTDQGNKDRLKKRHRMIALAFAFCLLVVVGCVVAVVFATRDMVSDMLTEVPTLAPIPATTTNNPPFENVTIAQSLTPMVAQDGNAFPASELQAQALQWLEEDLGQDTLVNPSKEELQQLLQRFALAVFWFATTNGTEWWSNTLWLSAANECFWYGVSCNDDQLITSIDLNKNSLAGKIPTELVLLSGLMHLDVSMYDDSTHSTSLTGPIPSNLLSLSNLKYIDLSNNALSGQLPHPNNLKVLTYLDLSGNNFSGTIQSEYGSMSALKHLDLSNNDLINTIPSQLGGLTALTHLSLAFNQGLNGTIPGQLGHLTLLESLNLHYNSLTETVPQELGSLTTLSDLTLNVNQLSGILPSDLGRLTQLTRLDLCCNFLTGPLPDFLGQLPSISSLILSNNTFTGTIPLLTALMLVEKLVLHSNALVGPIPMWLGLLTGLVTLDLSNNNLTGTIPIEIGDLLDLRSFGVGCNALSGPVPSSLGTLTWLDEVCLYGGQNNFSTPIPVGLEWLESLDCTCDSIS